MSLSAFGRVFSGLKTKYDQHVNGDNVKATMEALLLSPEKQGDKITDQWRELLILCGTKHPLRAKCCAHLASLLETQYERTGNVGLLDEVISLRRKELALSPEGHANRSYPCAHLVTLLQKRYKHTGDLDLLDESIGLQREILHRCPKGLSNRATFCRNLAMLLIKRYERTSDLHLLDEAIDLGREAVHLRPGGHPDHSAACTSLAISLNTRYDLDATGDMGLLDEAISLIREVLYLLPAGHLDRAKYCIHGAALLEKRYLRTVDINIVGEAIDLRREALALRPEGHPERIKFCSRLAVSLGTKYDLTGDLDLLNEAIGLHREAVNHCPDGHPDHLSSCTDLAISLNKRYERTNDVTFLDETISLEREVLAFCPEGHPSRFMACRNLAVALRKRYKRTSDLDLLDEAIGLGREVLHLCPKGDLQRADLCTFFAASLVMKYERTNDLDFLNEAINLNRQALDLLPGGHLDRAERCVYLSNSLDTLYRSTGDTGSRDEAVGLQREVLVLCPEGHPNRFRACHILAVSLSALYERTGNIKFLDECIDLQREALALRPEGHPDRSSSCTSLCVSLSKRSDLDLIGDFGLLDEIIGLAREALSLRPEGHPDRSIACANLAASLGRRYERTDEAGLLDEIIGLDREAFILHPEGDPNHSLFCGNLAVSLRKRFQRTKDEVSLHESFALLHEALTSAPGHAALRYYGHLVGMHLEDTSPFYDVDKAISHLIQSLENEHYNPPMFFNIVLPTLNRLWDLDLKDQHIRLLAVHQGTVKALQLLVHQVPELLSQLQLLKEHTSLGSDAFVNAVLAGDCPSGLETLELTHIVVWSQSRLGSDAELPRGDVTGRRAGALPGLDRSILGHNFETLRTVATDHPCVVLVGSRGRHYALIIATGLAQGYTLLKLNLTDEDLRSGDGAVRSQPGGQDGSEDLDSVVKRLSLGVSTPSQASPTNQYFEMLWHKIVKPVLNVLNFEASPDHVQPRLHWCPTGIFSSVPLHAAGIYNGTHRISCADFVVSSYTPTVTALLQAQGAANRSLSCSRLSLALVAEERPQDRGLLAVPGVNVEIELVAAVAKSSTIEVIRHQTGSTTIKGISEMIQQANIVHLACHRILDINDVAQSGFCLGDGCLTISSLMDLKLDNSLVAFLSVCETVKGDKEQPDQAMMHLPAAMLYSGFRSAIAPMWAVHEDDGPKVAKWFYEELLAKEVIDVDTIAYALGSAVGKLRDSGVSPDRWAPFIHMGA